MARPLRIQQAGAWYHVTARGHERRAIYRDDTDRFRFLELLSELSERFGARVKMALRKAARAAAREEIIEALEAAKG